MWFVGGKKQEYSTKVTINASAERVFRYLADPQLLKEWSSEIVEVEPIELDELGDNERHKVGALADLLIESQGHQVAMRQEVIKFDRNKMISLQRSNDFLLSTAIFRLEENGVDTDLTYRVKESRVGLRRVTGFFLGNDRQDTINEEIYQLKQLVESNLDKELGALPETVLKLAPGVPNDKIGNELEGVDFAPSNPMQPLPSGSPVVQMNRPDLAFDDQ